MKSTIFIPKKIKVGYQHRDDTYTKKLAYVIYYDNKGVLRKETSWKSWIHDEDVELQTYNSTLRKYEVTGIRPALEPNDYDNEPLEGFVLNKKAGGYSTGWNHRQTYCRVYDPRGFEFEITIPNLLYILENTSAIKGKGLEGKFVYGWDGKDLVLIPEDAPEYSQMLEYTNKQTLSIKKSDLKPGLQYETKKGETYTYLGYYPQYSSYLYGDQEKPKNIYWFGIENNNKIMFRTMSGLSSFTKKVSDDFDPKFPEYMENLEHMSDFSPCERDEIVDLTTKEELEDNRYNLFVNSKDNTRLYGFNCYYSSNDNEFYFANIDQYGLFGQKIERIGNSDPWWKQKSMWEYITIEELKNYTFEEILTLGLKIKKTYLKNGKEKRN